jgi:hypothetical protein
MSLAELFWKSGSLKKNEPLIIVSGARLMQKIGSSIELYETDAT